MLTSADLPKIYLGPFLKPSRRDYVNIDVIIATSFDSHVFQKFAFFLKIGFISIFAYWIAILHLISIVLSNLL